MTKPQTPVPATKVVPPSANKHVDTEKDSPPAYAKEQATKPKRVYQLGEGSEVEYSGGNAGAE